HYNWRRYHDPRYGRYLAVDPLNDGLNPYLYASNNPLIFSDPEGTHVVRSINRASDNIGNVLGGGLYRFRAGGGSAIKYGSFIYRYRKEVRRNLLQYDALEIAGRKSGANGLKSCGSGWSLWVVPEVPGCNSHDDRWGTPGYDKDVADWQLRQEVLSSCKRGETFAEKRDCETLADAYYTGVRTSIGDNAYREAQDAAKRKLERVFP
ncbi:TPA: hypothetical protein EYP38_03015, partial [Candidatus Micrarchaeota archaeon]|nr:hypothetical protein [Candidatus Micrarchaeota archaeon]